MYNINAVIFDLDNTLADRNLAFFNFCKNFIDEHFKNIELPDTVDNMIKYMIRTDDNGYRSRHDFYRMIIEKWKMNDVTIQQLQKSHSLNFSRCTTLDVDTLKVLEYLKPKYKLGMITNGSSETQNAKIDYVNLRNHFSSIIVSGDVGVKKPDKRIFEMSCRELNVKPDEAVYIGDNYEFDIVGAANAGLNAIWYTGHVENFENKYSYKYLVNRLSEITNILK